MKLKVFFDADALIAGSASNTGASFVLLQLCELGMLHGITSHQVVSECVRNIQNKLPEALPYFEKIIQSAIEVVDDPSRSSLADFAKMAHEKDLPILVSAIDNGVGFLVTFNVKHYRVAPPCTVIICRPGELLSRIRSMLSEMD